MNLTLTAPLHLPGVCPCPACRMAAMAEDIALITGWNDYAATVQPLQPLQTVPAGEWPSCPLHGFHDAADNGEPLSFCEKCEVRN